MGNGMNFNYNNNNNFNMKQNPNIQSNKRNGYHKNMPYENTNNFY